MSENNVDVKAIADAIGAFLRVAGDKSADLSKVGLVIRVSADTFKGVFSAEIGHVVCEKVEALEVPEAPEVEAPIEEAPEAKEGLRAEIPKNEALLRKEVKIGSYLV